MHVQGGMATADYLHPIIHGNFVVRVPTFQAVFSVAFPPLSGDYVVFKVTPTSKTVLIPDSLFKMFSF
jgi:hypothetical protein